MIMQELRQKRFLFLIGCITIALIGLVSYEYMPHNYIRHFDIRIIWWGFLFFIFLSACLSMSLLGRQEIQQRRFWLFGAGCTIIGLSIVWLDEHSTSDFITVIVGTFLSLMELCFYLFILLLGWGIISKNKTFLKTFYYGVIGLSCILIIESIGERLVWINATEGSKKAAYEIIKALERYRNEKGEYPEKLEELVPQYLTQIPKDKSKRPFFKYCDFYYCKSERIDNYFTLTFPLPSWMLCTYDSATKKWEIND